MSDPQDKRIDGLLEILKEKACPRAQVPSSLLRSLWYRGNTYLGVSVHTYVNTKPLQVRQKTKTGQDVKTTLKTAFQHFDRDESGAVTKDEFKSSLLKFGLTLTDQEVGTFFRRFDTNGGGTITYSEFSSSLFGGK